MKGFPDGRSEVVSHYGFVVEAPRDSTRLSM